MNYIQITVEIYLSIAFSLFFFTMRKAEKESTNIHSDYKKFRDKAIELMEKSIENNKEFKKDMSDKLVRLKVDTTNISHNTFNTAKNTYKHKKNENIANNKESRY